MSLPPPRRSAPRLVEPAAHRDRQRFTVTHLALFAVPVVLWLLYVFLRPAPEIVSAPPATVVPVAEAPAASETPATPARQPTPEERVAAALAAQQPATTTPVTTANTALHRSEARKNPLERFPRAETTWGSILNPSGIIPANGYAVWYLDTGHSRQPGIGDDGRPRQPPPQGPEPIPAYTPQPQQVVAQEKTGSISVDYSWNELHGIHSERFAAYWAGRVSVPQRSLYSIKNDMSWARVRVILDGHVLIDGEQEENITLELDAGDHLLEVEYINAWHTTKFALHFVPHVAEIRDNDLRGAIASLALPANTVVYAVGISRSTTVDNYIILNAPRGDTPYILVLTSNEPVQWELRGRAPVLAVYNHANEGSRVHADGNIPLLAWDTFGTVPPSPDDKPSPRCNCNKNGELFCQDNAPTLYEYAKTIERQTGFPLVGINRDSTAGALHIPEIPVHAMNLAPGEKLAHDMAKRREECARRTSR